MRLLIVEDEQKILNFLTKGFQEQGFCVDTAVDGKEAYFLASEEKYDCIVLDIMLPQLDGYKIIRKLRTENIKTPIIFLSAKDTIKDKLKGFELGGDDYLVKPFAFSELLARVRAMIQRKKDYDITKYYLNNLFLDAKKHVVKRDKKIIDLTPREFNLLQYLFEHQGEVVTRTMISESVWGYNFDSMSNIIDVHITNLRKKVDTDSNITLIHTKRGIGYILEERK
ncbi:response regulator [Candidatus Margulisiibacteriota bacterium]